MTIADIVDCVSALDGFGLSGNVLHTSVIVGPVATSGFTLTGNEVGGEGGEGGVGKAGRSYAAGWRG